MFRHDAQRNRVVVRTNDYVALAGENIQPVRLREALLTILGTGLFVVFVNFVLYFYLDWRNYNMTDAYIEAKWSLLDAQSAPVNWLLLGDSSASRALVPHLFEAHFGGTALNLATVGDWLFVDDVWMIQRYIERIGPPENVVIVTVYDMPHRELSANVLAQAPFGWNTIQSFDVRPSLTVFQETAYLQNRYMPLYSRVKTLQGILKDATHDPASLFEQYYQEFDVSDGYAYMGDDVLVEDSVRNDTEIHAQFVTNNTFEASAINVEALGQIVDYAEAYDFNVYIAPAPTYAGLTELEAFQKYFADFEVWLMEQTASSEKVHYLPGVQPFPLEDMEMSVDHVLPDAGRRYTTKLIARIEDLNGS